MIALGYDRDIATLDHTHPVNVSISIPARWSMVTLEDRVVTVPPGVVLDLGATAKAIAADRCADRVHRATGSGVLINLGGDIATAGPAPDGGWQVLVHDDADDPAEFGGAAVGGRAGHVEHDSPSVATRGGPRPPHRSTRGRGGLRIRCGAR